MPLQQIINSGGSPDTLPEACDKINDNSDDLQSPSTGLGASLIGLFAAGINGVSSTTVYGAISDVSAAAIAAQNTADNLQLGDLNDVNSSVPATIGNVLTGTGSVWYAGQLNSVYVTYSGTLSSTNVYAALNELAAGQDGGATSPMSASIALSFGFAGTSSSLPTNSGSVRIHSQADCFIEFGDASVSTTTSSIYFAAGTEIFIIPTGATHIAVKTAGEAGVLNVVGLDADAVEKLTTNTMIPVTSGSNSIALPSGTKTRLFAMTDCYINFGTSTVIADDTSMFFEAGTEIMSVGSATHIAAKRYTSNGGLYISGIV
jgi:hypothetical protein